MKGTLSNEVILRKIETKRIILLPIKTRVEISETHKERGRGEVETHRTY